MSSEQSEKIAILTSGGDSPGMNAAVRAVVRSSLAKGFQPVGVMRGYQGILDGDFVELGRRSVSNIIQRGGTILKTSRCPAFRSDEGIKLAAAQLDAQGIKKLAVIGGDGSLRGADRLCDLWDGQVVGLPGTIDNDLNGTDHTIGFDTAMNTALEAIDKIRDTADAHDRFFVVEVMGRHSGFIALNVAVAGGAEEVMLPETTESLEDIAARLRAGKEKGKSSSIIVIAEGEEQGNAFTIAEKLKAMSGYAYRVVVLGHIQRGGCPTLFDRVIATELGVFAVEQLEAGASRVMAGKISGKLVATPFKDTFEIKKPIDDYLLNLLPLVSW